MKVNNIYNQSNCMLQVILEPDFNGNKSYESNRVTNIFWPQYELEGKKAKLN